MYIHKFRKKIISNYSLEEGNTQLFKVERRCI